MAQEFKQLIPVKYDGIGPLPMARFQDGGDIQRWASYRYPHRDGQDVEPMGREPLEFSGEFLMFNGLEKMGNLWPKTYIEMRRRVRKPEPAFLEHPTNGQVFGVFTRFEAVHDIGQTNGCRVTFTFVEVSEDSDAEGVNAIQPLERAKAYAAAADAAFPLLPDVKTPPLFSITSAVAGIESLIQEGQYTADAIAGQVNEIKAKIDVLCQLKDMENPDNAEVFFALLAVNASLTEAAGISISKAPQIIAYEIERDMGALEVAWELYGDTERAEEVARLNPTRYPWYERGKKLQVSDA